MTTTSQNRPAEAEIEHSSLGIRWSIVCFGVAGAVALGGIMLASTGNPNVFDSLSAFQFAEASGQDSVVEAGRLNDAVTGVIWAGAIAVIVSLVGVALLIAFRKQKKSESRFTKSLEKSGWGALGVFAGITLIVAGSAFASAALALASDATDLRDSTASNIELAQAAYDSAKVVEDNAWAILKAAKASNESSGYGWCSFWQDDYLACELSKSRVDEAQNSLTAAQRGTSDAGSELNAELTEQQRIEPIVQQLLNQASIAEPVRIGTLIAGIAIALAGLGLLVFGIRGGIANRPTEGLKFTTPKLSLPSSIASSTKRCPKCDEKIRESATICKHCGSDLS